MNIEELKDRKEKLERDMEAALRRMLKEFYVETGVSPSSIGVYMQDVTTLTDSSPVRLLARVQCDLTI